MRSLRASVWLGTFLWTLGLLAAWALFITLYGARLQHSRIVVIHAYPHALMLVGVATMAAGFWVVRSALAPLRDLRRRLGAIELGDSRRIEGRYPNEVQMLVNDLNGLLAHQERAVGRAIAKAGDLAHGLKTPLALLTQEADRAAAVGQVELSSAIGEQVDRMRRQIDYHLAHARAAASGATPGARAAVADSAESLARTLRRLYASRGLTIDVHVPDGHVVRCQREDLDEMLGNLLDNACKWARTHVVLESVRRDGVIVMTVDDDGPGLDGTMLQAVLLRGVRADEASPGTGFGLAIVRDLAELYGGSIALERAAAGGLRAVLQLPAA
jgi:signal transduction histidine kinase